MSRIGRGRAPGAPRPQADASNDRPAAAAAYPELERLLLEFNDAIRRTTKWCDARTPGPGDQARQAINAAAAAAAAHQQASSGTPNSLLLYSLSMELDDDVVAVNAEPVVVAGADEEDAEVDGGDPLVNDMERVGTPA